MLKVHIMVKCSAQHVSRHWVLPCVAAAWDVKPCKEAPARDTELFKIKKSIDRVLIAFLECFPYR